MFTSDAASRLWLQAGERRVSISVATCVPMRAPTFTYCIICSLMRALDYPEDLLINFNLRASLRVGWKNGDTAMSELITMTELTSTELDAVCGGIFDFGNTVTQGNNSTQTMVNLFTLGGESEQNSIQSNVSLIGSAVVFPLHI
jgi:hypothetical protein